MHMNENDRFAWNRRTFLASSSIGFGAAALNAMLPTPACADARPVGGMAELPHFAPKAKRVIFLYMSGGPSHLELFDNKPALARMNMQPMPESFTRGQPIAQLMA